MRLITYDKIYRAYPELDQFNDEVCIQYLKRASRIKGAWIDKLKIFMWIIYALIIWSGITWLGIAVWPSLDSQYDLNKNDLVIGAVGSMWIVGLIGFPALVALFARDRWLKRCFYELLNTVRCGQCDYSLIGLELLDDRPIPSVRCPECGTVFDLRDLILTEADINPTLIKSS